MSMLALPESECQEILTSFRQHLPNIPDALLRELAANYGLDAVVDIDPNDVIEILSGPGAVHRIEIALIGNEASDEMHYRLHDELAKQCFEPGRIVGSLLTIYFPSAKLADIGLFVRGVIHDDGESVVKKGWGWYAPQPFLHGIGLVWIVRLSR